MTASLVLRSVSRAPISGLSKNAHWRCFRVGRRMFYHETSRSAAIRRRSRCGAVRWRPVASLHFFPGAALQVGQATASTCFGLSSLFMTERYCPKPIFRKWSILNSYGNSLQGECCRPSCHSCLLYTVMLASFGGEDPGNEGTILDQECTDLDSWCHGRSPDVRQRRSRAGGIF